MNGPNAGNRIHGNDRDRDGLSGPVTSVEYTRTHDNPMMAEIACQPDHFRFLYDERENHTDEFLFDANGLVARRTVFRYDDLGNLIQCESYTPDGIHSSETTDKQYGWFDPLALNILETNGNVRFVDCAITKDSYGNWTKREYRIHQTTRVTPARLGWETREIHYKGIEEPNPTPRSAYYPLPVRNPFQQRSTLNP